MYMYIYVLYIHHTHMYLPCAHNSPLTYYTLVHQICVWIHTCAEHTAYTSYICVFALCEHLTSDHSYSRMTNVCMENIFRGGVLLAQGKYTCVWCNWYRISNMWSLVCLWHTLATHYNTLHHTATHYNTLQHVASHVKYVVSHMSLTYSCMSNMSMGWLRLVGSLKL